MKPETGLKDVRNRSLAGPMAAAAAPKEDKSQSRWILVVDDDEGSRQMQRIVLNLDDFQVMEAADGFQALELLRTSGRAFCLILIDYEMPGMNGDELAAEIRRTDRHTPIMLITARDTIGQEHIRKWGIQALLHKPYEIGVFLEAVKNLIEGKNG